MTTERDLNRIVRSWLQEDQHESANRILELALLQVDTTPQRPPLRRARRFSDMTTYAKLAIAAAAVVAVALVGYNMLPPGGGNVGVGPTAPPSPAPSPTAVPSSSPSALAFPPAGQLEVGRHSMTRSDTTFSVEMPAGWSSNGDFRLHTLAGQAAFIFWSNPPTNVYADPCAQEPLDPPAGDTPAELAAAVAAIPGTDLVEGPSDVTIDGQPGKHVSIKIREDVDCSASAFFLWYREAEGPADGRWPDALGETTSVWIIDVDGAIVWIDGSASPSSTPSLQAEMRQIVESIQFE